MFVSFDSLPETSKIWIYPSNRKFYTDEIEVLNQKIGEFVESWKAEESEFKASYQLKHNRFIILAADDKKAKLTAEDIDVSVAFILSLQEDYQVILLDRLNVCFKQGEFVQYKDLKEFKKLIKNKSVSKYTIIFDNLVSNMIDFKEVWEVPITESWYNRFLK